ncbi:MAG: adenylate/guanylate cyclase domain-containing protein [Pseudomonadota bacterium]
MARHTPFPRLTARPEIERHFRGAERRAEQAIAIVRIVIALILAFALTQLVTNLPPADEPMLQVQLAVAIATLGGYALIGIVALILSTTGRMSQMMALVFVTLDVAFVIGSLWINKFNTGLPSNYLAAYPAVWMIPVVLTFGALRYSPATQLYILALMVVGLLSLSLPLSSWVPREAVEGGTVPTQILPFFDPPPNVMRLIMVLMAGGILFVVVLRTRLILAAALDENRRRLQMTRYLPRQVAAMITESDTDALRKGRRQPVVILFVDIRDFTGRAESMDPAALGAFLAKFRGEIGAAVGNHGGVVDKFVGDAAMVVFGLPQPTAQDADSAVACGLDILARVAALSDVDEAAGAPPLHVGVGIHAGAAFVGAIGDDMRLEFTVVGDVVNVASRVENATKAAHVPLLITDAVKNACRKHTKGFAQKHTVEIRGKATPVDLWALSDSALKAALAQKTPR